MATTERLRWLNRILSIAPAAWLLLGLVATSVWPEPQTPRGWVLYALFWFGTLAVLMLAGVAYRIYLARRARLKLGERVGAQARSLMVPFGHRIEAERMIAAIEAREGTGRSLEEP